MESHKVAWLAGLWDGEGSIGISKNGTGYMVQAQMSMTHEPTIRRALEIIDGLGITSRGYTYQERNPEKYRDAHYIRVNGMMNILRLGRALIPYSVTKLDAWLIAMRWVEHRIEYQGGLDAKGNVRRGGRQGQRAYSEIDHEAYQALRSINVRCRQDGRDPRRSADQFGRMGSQG